MSYIVHLHRSETVRGYKRTSDALNQSVSSTLSAPNGEKAVISKVRQVEVKRKCEFDPMMDVFDPQNEKEPVQKKPKLESIECKKEVRIVYGRHDAQCIKIQIRNAKETVP